ncbi:shikimate kinase [Hydromonas duriensis]|uniref:Shikimate kinase n=1 Tax=Hydromonas duriensis TaxID=1527608 RepID=A0A4R6YA09_9BURK|nr:shikimate kinase [Hydromonas duriensis]TDR32304.1 shikimate kinase [Hydromonas duriensis]
MLNKALQSSDFKRVVVIGNSCAGKTTFANELAHQLGCSMIDLDELFWDKNWTPKTTKDFIQLTAQAVSDQEWIVAGDFSIVRNIIWSRATLIIWLDYSFSVIIWRSLRRTFRRLLTQESLWHGNHESFKRVFLSRDSILLWVIRTFKQNRLKYSTLQQQNEYSHLKWATLQQPQEASIILKTLR